MANINKIKLSGTSYNIQDKEASKTVELTQAQYNALANKDPNTFYIITDAQGADLSQYYTSAQTNAAIDAAVSGKQDTLSAGTGIDITDNVISATGGGGSVSSAITSGDTNAVAGGVLFDELRIPTTSEVETILQWENYDGGRTTNYPVGASKLVFYLDESQMTEGYFIFENYTDYSIDLGKIFMTISDGTIDVTYYENVTYTIDGNVVTVNYPSIAADVNQINSSYDCYWTVKAYNSGTVYEPLIDQVTANTISIQGKQDTLSAGTGISISGNVISATGGGGGITSGEVQSMIDESVSGKQDTLSAGTGIDITDNVISATGGGSITIDPSLDSGSTNAVANSAITTAINSVSGAIPSTYINAIINDADQGFARFFRFSTPSNFNYFLLRNAKINGRQVLNSGYSTDINEYSLVETSAITTTLSSGSTDSQVPSAKAVYDQLGGIKIVKLTESEYAALVTKDNNTLYVVIPDPSN